MAPWLISLLVAIGFTAWAYSKLAKSNGNATPASNVIIASCGGIIIYLILFTLLKFILNF